MRRWDQIIGLIWLALGIGITIEAIHLGLGELRFPGIGFMAFLIGISLGFSGFILTVFKTVKGKREDDKIWAGQNWKNVVIPLITLLIYIALLETLGFLIATFLLIFLLFKITTSKRWFSPLLTSLIVVLLSYLLFFVWLKIPLPKGVLGIG